MLIPTSQILENINENLFLTDNKIIMKAHVNTSYFWL